MKNIFATGGFLITLSAAWLCGAGCTEGRAVAQELPPPNPGAANSGLDVAAGEGALALPFADDDTNAPPPQLVKPAVVPDTLKLSPNLNEVVKLIHSGVSEPIILAYITNSNQPFNLGSDEIVYLNDLGVSSEVLATLIQHETLPSIAEKKRIGTVEPLPPGVALNTPAPNVYPPAAPTQAVTPPLTPPADVAATAQPTDPVSMDYFYSSLSPYGNWVQVEGYGLCWQPTVAVVNAGWQPYSDRGRWLWTDSGWYWYSDYSWGWAPFHYGRWCRYPRVGWVWAPDTVWGPSWVSWRYTHDYCGWAPLPPRCYAVSGFGLWFGGHAVSVGFDFGLPFSHFTFVPLHRLGERNLSRHFVHGTQTRTIYNNSTVINNYTIHNGNVVNQGMGRDRIASMAKVQIPTTRIVDARAPQGRIGTRAEHLEGSGSSLVVTRPHAPGETAVPSKPPRVEPRLAVNSGSRNATVNSPARSGFGTTPTTLPNRLSPETRVNSSGEVSRRDSVPSRGSVATATAPSATPKSTDPAVIGRNGRPNVFAPGSSGNQSSPSTATTRDSQGRPAYGSGKAITPLPPVNNHESASPAVANRNQESVESLRQKAPQGSIFITRDNAAQGAVNGSTAINRQPGVPSTSRPQQQLPSWMNQQSANPRGTVAAPSTAVPPLVPRTESPRGGSFRAEAPQNYPGNAPAVRSQPSAPAFRPTPVAPPVRSEAPRMASPAPAISAPPPVSHSAPSVPSAAPRSSGGEQRSAPAGGGGGGGGKRGRGDH